MDGGLVDKSCLTLATWDCLARLLCPWDAQTQKVHGSKSDYDEGGSVAVKWVHADKKVQLATSWGKKCFRQWEARCKNS